VRSVQCATQCDAIQGDGWDQWKKEGGREAGRERGRAGCKQEEEAYFDAVESRQRNHRREGGGKQEKEAYFDAVESRQRNHRTEECVPGQGGGPVRCAFLQCKQHPTNWRLERSAYPCGCTARHEIAFGSIIPKVLKCFEACVGERRNSANEGECKQPNK
jgi:hypothetical protein